MYSLKGSILHGWFSIVHSLMLWTKSVKAKFNAGGGFELNIWQVPFISLPYNAQEKSSDFQNLLYCIVRFRTFPLGNITLAICFNDIASVIKNIKLERKPQAITLFWMTNYRKCSPLSHPSTTHLQQWHLPWLWKVQVKIPVELTTSAIVCSFGITQPSRMENNNPQSSFWLIFCYDLYKHFEGRRIGKKTLKHLKNSNCLQIWKILLWPLKPIWGRVNVNYEFTAKFLSAWINTKRGQHWFAKKEK